MAIEISAYSPTFAKSETRRGHELLVRKQGQFIFLKTDFLLISEWEVRSLHPKNFFCPLGNRPLKVRNREKYLHVFACWSLKLQNPHMSGCQAPASGRAPPLGWDAVWVHSAGEFMDTWVQSSWVGERLERETARCRPCLGLHLGRGDSTWVRVSLRAESEEQRGYGGLWKSH